VKARAAGFEHRLQQRSKNGSSEDLTAIAGQLIEGLRPCADFERFADHP
jgi:hypothetical protein